MGKLVRLELFSTFRSRLLVYLHDWVGDRIADAMRSQTSSPTRATTPSSLATPTSHRSSDQMDRANRIRESFHRAIR